MGLFGRGAAKDVTQGRFPSDGVSLAYEVLGQGAPVLFVHGFASSIETNWKTPGILKAVAEAGFQAVAFDGRGHGQSDRPSESGAYRPEAMVKDVENLIAHLGLTRPALVGYSMGARIALRLLCERPVLARAAILGGVGDGVFGSSDVFGVRIAEALLAPDVGEVTDKIARRFRLFAESQGNDMRALAQCILEAMEPIDPAGLTRIAQPVLVLAGSDDDQITEPQALARRIPGARTEIISRRNHMTIIGDARFRQAIVGFLKSVG